MFFLQSRKDHAILVRVNLLTLEVQARAFTGLSLHEQCLCIGLPDGRAFVVASSGNVLILDIDENTKEIELS
jgi:hypothetical protein